MKKSLIILISLIVIILVLSLIKFLSTTKENDQDYLKRYLDNNNYKQENDLYVKVITDDDEINDTSSLKEYMSAINNKNSSEYTVLSLDTDKFIYKKENRTYSDDVEKIYNGTINLKEDKIVDFDYMINIYTSQIMIEGSYDTKSDYSSENFKCSLSYQSGLEDDEEETEKFYCLLAKVETLDFISNINELKSDKRIYSIINK